LTAPKEPGTYEIRFRYAQDYDCTKALDWWLQDDEPTVEATIGVITVSSRPL